MSTSIGPSIVVVGSGCLSLDQNCCKSPITGLPGTGIFKPIVFLNTLKALRYWSNSGKFFKSTSSVDVNCRPSVHLVTNHVQQYIYLLPVT